jgi:hypothetical protein
MGKTRKVNNMENYYGVKKGSPRSGVAIDGFYRVSIQDADGRVAGDSGWHHNVMSNLGLANYIAYNFKSTGGSTGLSPGFFILGSLQSSHASNLVNATGAFGFASAVAIGTIAHTVRANQASGHTVRFTASFSSGAISNTDITIASIGLIHATNATSAMCAGSFASSTMGNAQAINCTYDIVFSATATA